MKNVTHLALGASLILGSVFPTPLMAAPEPPREEPATIFTQGANPEWNATHVDYHGLREDHRAYHKGRAVEHQEWHAQWNGLEGTAEYDQVHRTQHETVNARHRRAHRALLESYNATTTGGVSMPVVPVASPKPVPTRERKSRRLIVAEHEQWLREHAKPLKE
ncbi:hypothetical protein A3D88_01905 [Candidatus Peribacteria bacterium RIFCSPHIGHO2_02_FULL_52_16]|nr:MAG: hypothetical protein A2706_05100 [Candidatus Peribacteria bacterium RIFCSPHIGHO2_01_FULL_51_35]OGJ61140.1 MAG: hypothetical protein A3D88_01905 [Candidatus Peribacteria bacterium RIFCSPHIGHO2_02_FULL_52_16]